MTRRLPHIVQRVPIFVGCEGESEAGYAGLLDFFAKAESLPVHVHIERLSPAGDPLARVERSVRILTRLRTRREPFKHRFILLDTDQIHLALDRAAQAQQLAARNSIELIWQDPCFEAVLLRHLPQCATLRPMDNAGTMRALAHAWPGYAKPLDRMALAKNIDLDAIRRAGAVEPELARLLKALGLIA